MFKKARVRQIIEQLQKNLSDREISGVLGVSRNSAARIRQASDERRKEWDELLMMSDDELCHFFCPDKFKPKSSYAPADYAYIHRELSKVGVTGALLWEEYCEKCKNEGEKACSYPTFAEAAKDIPSAGIMPAMWSINRALHLKPKRSLPLFDNTNAMHISNLCRI